MFSVMGIPLPWPRFSSLPRISVNEILVVGRLVPIRGGEQPPESLRPIGLIIGVHGGRLASGEPALGRGGAMSSGSRTPATHSMWSAGDVWSSNANDGFAVTETADRDRHADHAASAQEQPVRRPPAPSLARDHPDLAARAADLSDPTTPGSAMLEYLAG
jgi:hypothetical protein